MSQVLDKQSKNALILGLVNDLTKLIGPSSIDPKDDLNDQSEFLETSKKFLKHFTDTLECDIGSIYLANSYGDTLQGFNTIGYVIPEGISDIVYDLQGINKNSSDLMNDPSIVKKGIGAYVAVTGEYLWFDKQYPPKSHPAHAGKIDKRQWIDGREFKNCGNLPLRFGSEIIGVLKLENFKTEDKDYIISDEKRKLTLDILPLITLAMDSLRRRLRDGDKWYRITISKERNFEKMTSGHVVLRHALTSICKSDFDYFTHNKEKEKLKERLPLILGHETVGIIDELRYGEKYKNGEFMQIGDRVVVIPQIPCNKCPTCEKSKDGTTDSPGENYCENVKHMASNAEGSLRTRYRYWSDQLIKIPKDIENELAVLTEPIAQLVQVWRELGFSDEIDKKGKMILHLNKFNEITLDNAFNIEDHRFDEYFKIFAHDRQTPRTLLRLKFNSNSEPKSWIRQISHYKLMRRGLFLSAIDKNDDNEEKIILENPKILILGTGPFAYFAALLITSCYGVSRNDVYVYGRRDEPLNRFEPFANTINVLYPRINKSYFGYEKIDVKDEKYKNADLKKRQETIANSLEGAGIKFNIILDCIGGEATQNLIDFSLDLVDQKGIIGLFGFFEKAINIDFEKAKNKQVTFKGFYRACRQSYLDVIKYLHDETFTNSISIVTNNYNPPIIVDSDEKMNNAFLELDKKDFWGKVLVKLDKDQY